MTQNNLVIALVVIAWLCILLPSVVYLITSWKVRKQKLFDLFNDETIELYYKQFYPSKEPEKRIRNHKKKDAKPLDLKKDFELLFRRLYGRKNYVLPLIILAIVSGIGLSATLFSILNWLGNSPFSISYPAIAISAVLGAYAWVVGDQFNRFRVSDFTYHDVYNCIYRFLIAIPLGISLGAFIKDDLGIPMAFLLAAFPLQSLLKISRRLVSQKMGIGEENPDGQLDLEQLQSISKPNAERFNEEGIQTITQLAWADPIDLTIKTNYEFNYVVDSISQALLWIYFGAEVKRIYPLSLRGAQEVQTFLADLDNNKKTEIQSKANVTLLKGSELIGIPSESFEYTLRCVGEDPYTKFLCMVWSQS